MTAHLSKGFVLGDPGTPKRLAGVFVSSQVDRSHGHADARGESAACSLLSLLMSICKQKQGGSDRWACLDSRNLRGQNMRNMNST